MQVSARSNSIGRNYIVQPVRMPEVTLARAHARGVLLRHRPQPLPVQQHVDEYNDRQREARPLVNLYPEQPGWVETQRKDNPEEEAGYHEYDTQHEHHKGDDEERCRPGNRHTLQRHSQNHSPYSGDTITLTSVAT